MKRFNEYEPSELLAMETEQLDKLIDLECAYRGVALLPEAPTPPEEVKAGPDVTVYGAGTAMFRDEGDAQKVCDLINSLPTVETYYLAGTYQYSGPQGVRSGERDKVEAPTKSRYWTEAHYDKHRSALAEYKEAKERYDKDRKEFERISAERSGVAEEIAAIRRQAQEDLDDRTIVTQGFDRYVELADGDREQALKFYLAQTTYDESFVRSVLGMELPQEEEPPLPDVPDEPTDLP